MSDVTNVPTLAHAFSTVWWRLYLNFLTSTRLFLHRPGMIAISEGGGNCAVDDSRSTAVEDLSKLIVETAGRREELKR